MHEHRHRWALTSVHYWRRIDVASIMVRCLARADVIDQDPLRGPRIKGRAALGDVGGQSVLFA